MSPYTVRVIDKNNNVKWVMEALSPITYQGKTAVLVNSMDITSQKEAEE